MLLVARSAVPKLLLLLPDQLFTKLLLLVGISAVPKVLLLLARSAVLKLLLHACI